VPRFKYLKWPKGATAEEAEKEAVLSCPHCDHPIKDASRTWMNERGCMVAPGQKPLPYDPDNGSVTDGGAGFILIDYDDDQAEKRIPWGDFLLPGWSRTQASFWVSGLCTFSPKKSYGFIASKFIDAHNSGEHERLQAVYNTDLGELYRVSGDAPQWQAVLGCAGEYVLGYVHPDITTITSGVDVQKNRLVFVVRGWAPGLTSYLIMRGELWGDTDQDDVWEALENLLDDKFDGLPISKMVIDSGYRKNEVYSFCREHRPVAVPSKGRDTMDKPYSASLVDVNYRGRVIKGGMQLWHYDSDVMKSWVHARIDWDKTKTGAWFLPSDIDEDYCKQIIAEQRVVKPSGQITWVKVATDNHYLDAEALAYLAARIVGIKKQASRQEEKPKPKPKPQHQDTGGFGSEDWSGRL
jgi:phage terminase large subunit GpA-like protein